jgi:hypothetical protein
MRITELADRLCGLKLAQSQSQNYVTNDGQSASRLGIKHPSGAYDQIFISVRPELSRDALYSLARTPQKQSVYCWGPLTERLHSNDRCADLQKTSHVIPSQRLHWCTDSYLATSNKHSFTKTQLLLLRVLTCLLSRYLTMFWPTALQCKNS